MSNDFKINIAGLDETLKALKNHDEVQYKLVQREITRAAANLVRMTRFEIMSARVLSNWGRWTFSRDGRDFSFDPSRVAASFKVTRGTGRIKKNRGQFVINAIGIASVDAVAQIFHTAGYASEKSAGKHKSAAYGDSFRANMAANVPKPRGLWAAVDQDQGATARMVEAAVREAERITGRITN